MELCFGGLPFYFGLPYEWEMDGGEGAEVMLIVIICFRLYRGGSLGRSENDFEVMDKIRGWDLKVFFILSGIDVELWVINGSFCYV